MVADESVVRRRRQENGLAEKVKAVHNYATDLHLTPINGAEVEVEITTGEGTDVYKRDSNAERCARESRRLKLVCKTRDSQVMQYGILSRHHLPLLGIQMLSKLGQGPEPLPTKPASDRSSVPQTVGPGPGTA